MRLEGGNLLGQRTLGAVGSVTGAAVVAEALVTSRRLEPPCWLVMRRILAADICPPFFSLVFESAFESSALREDLAGGMVGILEFLMLFSGGRNLGSVARKVWRWVVMGFK